jgi:hypothetical protein
VLNEKGATVELSKMASVEEAPSDSEKAYKGKVAVHNDRPNGEIEMII